MTIQTEELVSQPSSPIKLKLPTALELTDEQLYQLCQANRELRIEQTADGELLIMPPTGGETGGRNASLTGQLWLWNRQTRLGRSFDSSTGFKLPNGANRSPDASWLKLERWNALTPQQQEKFLPLCPDFVIELRSSTDSLVDLQTKMQEYLDNGTTLGWLIDPKASQVWIYRPARPVEVLQAPKSLSGEAVLPGFVLELQEILA